MSENEELDPEIAELLGVDQVEKKEEVTVKTEKASGKIIPKTELQPDRRSYSAALQPPHLHSYLRGQANRRQSPTRPSPRMAK